MTTRTIRSKADLAQLMTFLDGRKLPLTVTIKSGKNRSAHQNRLVRLWCGEIAEQLGDQTPEEIRGHAKLTMGVPILRAEDDEFREKYDAVIRPLPYETKLACMMEPIDFPVTRRMSVDQQTRFLDHMHRHWSSQGLMLTNPEAV